MSHKLHHMEEQHGSLVDRRDFLRLAGFSFAGAVLAGCQQGTVEKAIPFLVQPEEVTPGLAYWYATTCAGCNAGCGVLAKNRDGRPIKLEGNPAHPISRGGLCAIGQASILALYDSHRLQGPLIAGTQSSWDELDRKVQQQLESARNNGKRVRLLTGSIQSPTTRSVISRFLRQFKDAKHIQYDALSNAAILDAHEITHGRRILPQYRLDRAETIVSFDADFLGTWISPAGFTASYSSSRRLQEAGSKFTHHTHFESRVSLTGSNADERIAVSPADMDKCIERLAAILGARVGQPLPSSVTLDAKLEEVVHLLARRLAETTGRSLVLCGVNSLRLQLLTNFINHVLGGYGATVDIEQQSHQLVGNDKSLVELIGEINHEEVDVLILAGVNPVYDLPSGAQLAESLKKTGLVVTVAERLDETADVSICVCPLPHFLEAWDDAESVSGVVSITQPTIPSLRNARTLAESLHKWGGGSETAYELVRAEWKQNVFRRQSSEMSFENFWKKSLYDGFAVVSNERQSFLGFDRPGFSAALSRTSNPASKGIRLLLHPSLTMLDGRHAHNAWLQELPDPVTKIVWDNYASISRGVAERVGVEQGDILTISIKDAGSIELPAHIQPGQHDSVVAVSLGYGRKGTDRFTNIGPEWIQSHPTVAPGELVGKNAAPFAMFSGGLLNVSGREVSLVASGRRVSLAATQEYHSLHEPNLLGRPTGKRRPIVQETTLVAYAADPSSGSFQKHQIESMWAEDHKYTGHHWGMVIDLTACTGCSACVVGCQAENNIPVVGKDEVRRNREVTWIRIDRYYDESNDQFSVSHQPMMCQHCDNAPCETVCPVLATVHNDEGLNQQVYNRCVGTRYCANNCPYKIRRFNWFQYSHGDEMQRMVLNPDVTVRDRGVMEKCSFCVQRIQLAKIEAKQEGRTIADGDIQPACVQSCPAKAMSCGDMNDPASEVAKRIKDPRHYRVLEEIGVRPSVGYMTLVRDRIEKKEEGRHG